MIASHESVVPAGRVRELVTITDLIERYADERLVTIYAPRVVEEHVRFLKNAYAFGEAALFYDGLEAVADRLGLRGKRYRGLAIQAIDDFRRWHAKNMAFEFLRHLNARHYTESYMRTKIQAIERVVAETSFDYLMHGDLDPVLESWNLSKSYVRIGRSGILDFRLWYPVYSSYAKLLK